ncbi:hypothetical protein [Aquirufa nivalisilvae]|uniref:hypothetical protein n=1 Tax=Aquirufa TaxID=2676247 RepID=UPI0022A99EDF|nr:hypothetical protein [Aquirufa nivalisilvae]MCZ2480005.1 hypothetical protein [Aquirufa nivalisilvae]
MSAIDSNSSFDSIQAERQEYDLLLHQGVKFTTPKRSILKYFSKQKDRTWVINQPFLGTLDYLSSIFIQMDFSEERIKENALNESKRLAAINTFRCAKIIAIAILNDKIRIKLFSNILARYFLWRITPSKLFQLALMINTMSNVADFTNSIRLMSVQRTAAPQLIEIADQKG